MASLMALKLNAVSSSGAVLSLPQSSGFESSLTLLKKNYKLTNVFFWGKVTRLGRRVPHCDGH